MSSLFTAASALCRPYSNTQLTANVQTAAGIISLLNDLFASDDRQSFGFINPWLYSYGLKGIKDIIFGGNPGCGTTGFVADSGWDPVRPPHLCLFEFIFDVGLFGTLY